MENPEAPIYQTTPRETKQASGQAGHKKEVSQMHKKLIMTCMAIAAFASFVIAPSASATTLTESGTALAVGSSVEAKNEGNVEFTGGVTVTCSTATLKGQVTQNNSSGAVKWEVPIGTVASGTGPGGDCTSSLFGGAAKMTFNTKQCLEAGANDVLKVTGCGGEFTFSLNFTGTGTCKYHASSASGTYTTNSTPAQGSLAKAPVSGAGEGNGIFCPEEGFLTMRVNFHTTGGTTGLTLS